MSNDNDDIDALLDDALDNFETEQKAAQERSKEVAEQRAQSAKLLEEALNEESDKQQPGPGGELDPAQLMQMLTQLSTLGQQGNNGSENGVDAATADEQEAKLLQMASQLISGVAAATNEAGEKQQLNDALQQLGRVQDLSKQHQELSDAGKQAEADKVREELERISKRMQSQAESSAEQLKQAAAQGAALSGDEAKKLEELQKKTQETAAGGGKEDMTEDERKQLDNFLKAMMMASMQQTSNTSESSSESAAAAAAAVAENGSDSQQQQPPVDAAAAAAQREFMLHYFNMIFEKFTSIDDQYKEWFSTIGAKEKESSKISEADWARYKEQHASIQKLLQLRDKKDELFASAEKKQQMPQAEDDPIVGELNVVVEKLQSLGEPPEGLKVSFSLF